MLAISTMWNALEQPDGAAMFDALKDLGFENIALSQHLTLEQVEQLKPMFREIGQAHPPVIQNYCPILPGTTQSDVDKDKVQLASLDNDERKEAIRRTIQTMQLAIDMEIPTVILRLGEVDTYNRSYLMTDLYNYGEREFEAFNKKVTEATEWRKRKEAKHHDAALRSLDELNEAALRLELNIAIENRPQYFQIPNFDEVGLFFDEFYGSPMRYWHDVGHAALQEKLGLCWSQEWIRTYGEHLIGVTLHDLQELDPYHPPGTGDLDWDEIFAQIPNEAVKVIEIKHVNSEEIIQARELCESFTPIE
ncbi:sugar phosphate isomerase/epimerase [Candidatus Poribacteria bacterium]|nr:sugar phosphate isomerase/epimerase [Candidatus Poribacteria bacterium]MYF55504.1 sugar phosphate isomerase/epimerase [Candidatus Poribacteria bacterium]MYI92787.1 sugar phosphate isomerase/epimerase [Candidatus Poribacteria bacterium]